MIISIQWVVKLDISFFGGLRVTYCFPRVLIEGELLLSFREFLVWDGWLLIILKAIRWVP